MGEREEGVSGREDRGGKQRGGEGVKGSDRDKDGQEGGLLGDMTLRAGGAWVVCVWKRSEY